MGLEREALEWLYYCRAVADIAEQCQQLVDTDKCIYKLTVCFDVCGLLQYNVELGEALLHSPERVWSVFVRAVYHIVRVVCSVPLLTSPSQLLLYIRLHSLPSLTQYTVNSLSDLSPLKSEPRFYSFSGVVTSLTLRETFTEAACFRCTRDSCPDDECYIRLHSAGATEATTMQCRACSLCGHPITEDLSQRLIADRVHMTLVPRCALRMCSRGERYQSLLFVVRSDLCDLVEVGSVREVTGVPTHRLNHSEHTTVTTLVEVNNVCPLSPPPLTPLTPSMMELLRDYHSNPWVLSSTLAHSLASHIAPPGTYHRVKLCLLLSLACLTSSSSKTRPLHLVAMTTDTPLMIELLRYGATLAPQSTVHSSNFDLYGGTHKDGTNVRIEGGALSLAGEGVCLVGAVGMMKKELRDKLERSLESGVIEVGLPKKVSAGHTLTSLPLHCALWGWATPTETNIISKGLLDQLGLLMSCDPSPYNHDDLIARLTIHTLYTAMGNMATATLSDDDIMALVAMATRIEPVLMGGAEILLEGFFAGSRRVRGSDMPHTALETLRTIALAHARLSLRERAVESDALVAVLLYEESLLARHGYSVLNLSPAHCCTGDSPQTTHTEFTDLMRDVEKRLSEFCHCSNPGGATLLPEE